MTPRGYLSYTQMTLWERSPKKYEDIYVHGGTFPTNRGMEFGKMVADVIEKGGTTGDPTLDFVISTIPKFKNIEHEIKTDLQCNGELIPLLSKLDTFNLKPLKFKEYKTGKIPWTQNKVDKDTQLTFYATAIYSKHKEIPKDIELVWIPTEYGENGAVQAKSTDFCVFKTKRDIRAILEMSARIQRAWRGISEMYEKKLIE